MPAAAWPSTLQGALLLDPARADDLRHLWSTLDQAEMAGQLTATAPAARPRYALAGSTAVIPVKGLLINRGNLLGGFGATSYAALAAEIDLAASNSAVRRIVLDIDSGGGPAAGLELVEDALEEAKRVKPVYASVTGLAASAAYWIAATADEIAMTARSFVGSIGVVAMHLDVSRSLDQQGVTPTLVFAGARKVDGHPFGPLPDDVRSELQTRVDQTRMAFAQAVAAGRPGMTVAKALATEARLYAGTDAASGREDAIAEGLADRIASLREVVSTTAPPMARSALIAGSPQARGQEAFARHLAATAGISTKQALGALAAASGRPAVAVPEHSTEQADLEAGAKAAREALGMR